MCEAGDFPPGKGAGGTQSVVLKTNNLVKQNKQINSSKSDNLNCDCH